jgi:Domain of unknown function (DUF4868)
MPTDPAQFPRDDLAAKAASAIVQVVFAYKDSPTDWKFRRLPLHGGLQEDFRVRIESSAQSLRDEFAGRAYDPEWDLQSDEFFYLSNDPPVGGNFFTRLAGFADLPDFEEHKRIRAPSAWIVVAQFEDVTLAYFGARITTSAILRRNSPALRIIYRDNAFDTLDDTVVTLSPDFHWIAWQDVIVVLDKNNFHAMFRDIPALVAKVEEHMATVTQHIGIDNAAEFVTRIKAYPAMMVKLQRIIDRADMHTRPPEVLRNYGQDYGIAVDWNGDRMVFDGSVEKQWNILRLLDEARTLGPVTGKHWETSSKVEV